MFIHTHRWISVIGLRAHLNTERGGQLIERAVRRQRAVSPVPGEFARGRLAFSAPFVASSNFPRFDRNLNTGALVATDTGVEVATQTVHHEPAMQSVLSLPLIPAAAEPSRL